MSTIDKAEARQLLIKSKFYRAFAMVFAVLGLVVFGILYSVTLEGNIFNALESPSSLIMLVFPFLPAIFLTWKSGKMEDKAQEFFSDSSGSE